MWENFQFSSLASNNHFPSLLEAIGRKRDSTRRLSVVSRSTESPGKSKRRCNSAQMASDRPKLGTTTIDVEPGGESSSNPLSQHHSIDSDRSTGVRAINSEAGTQIEELFIPQDPLQQKELLEALNANNEMIRKIIMRQSLEGSPRISPRPNTNVISNPSGEAERISADIHERLDRSPSELGPDKEHLMAAATQQQSDQNSPRRMQQQPPGPPSSSPYDADRTPKPPENHLMQEKNDRTRRSSTDFHTTASVVQQLSTPRAGIHSTASIRGQLETQRPEQKETTEGESKEAAQNGASKEGSQPKARSYAQATNPSAAPVNGIDQDQPPAWSPQKNKDYVKEAMLQMPQPEIRADPSKIRRKVLNEETVERVRKKLQTLESKALVLFTGNSNPLRDTVVKWVQDQFTIKLGVTVNHVKNLGPGHHLIVVGSSQERARIFDQPPKDFNGKYMRLSPWTPDYDARVEKQKRKPVWIDIMYVNPAFEEEGIALLKELGTLLHVAGIDKEKRHKFPHIRGLVLMDRYTEWPEAMVLELEGTEVEFTIDYEDLPEGCFICHQTGHLARTCPQVTTTKEVDPEEFEVAFKEAVAHKAKKDKAREERKQKREAVEQNPSQGEARTGRIIPINKTSLKGVPGASSSRRGAGSNRFGPLAFEPDEDEEYLSQEEEMDEDHNSVRLDSGSEAEREHPKEAGIDHSDSRKLAAEEELRFWEEFDRRKALDLDPTHTGEEEPAKQQTQNGEQGVSKPSNQEGETTVQEHGRETDEDRKEDDAIISQEALRSKFWA
ncbi:hypothetical protein R1sor_017733 [Riccia sorocarpa]|uniref:CCHC-type domain-containing protein n=1 Tax=Riccia sorocarpa TaxID=122646 RepID=A0ABD3I851_9MARC